MDLREKQREHTAQLLLEAAGRAFASQGYHATSMEEIAKEAGCGTATLYSYFKGKKEIFAQLIGDLSARYLAGLEIATGDAEDFDDGLERYFSHVTSFARKDRSTLLLLIGAFQSPDAGTLPDPDAMRANEMQHVQILSGLMERGKCAGALRDIEPTYLTMSLIGLTHTFLYTWLMGIATEDIDDLMRTCGEIFLHGARINHQEQGGDA